MKQGDSLFQKRKILRVLQETVRSKQKQTQPFKHGIPCLTSVSFLPGSKRLVIPSFNFFFIQYT